jgi:hypothetical protein
MLGPRASSRKGKLGESPENLAARAVQGERAAWRRLQAVLTSASAKTTCTRS